MYQDYVTKIRNMASETKDIENNMRHFSDIIRNMVSTNSIIQNAN